LIALDATPPRIIANNHESSSKIFIAEPDFLSGEEPETVVSDVKLMIAVAGLGACEGDAWDVFLNEGVPEDI
jgi:hypothetical protein